MTHAATSLAEGNDRIVRPCAGIAGALSVPGDKSVSHRAAMLSALARGESRIEGFLFAEDCVCTLRAMQALGAQCETDAAGVVRVRGAQGGLRAPAGVLDMGNSGTGMRLLAGLLAGQPFVSELTGDASLRSRPMNRIREPLERMGAKLELLGKGGTAPVRVTGGALKGIEYRSPVASAQVKSCVLLAGLFAEGETAVVEPRATRDHTERMLRAAGVPVEVSGTRVAVRGCGRGGPELSARRWTVPGDFSSACFWLAAAAARSGSSAEVRHVGLNPRRTALLDILRRMGADVETADGGNEAEGDWEPAGHVRVRGRSLRGVEVGGEEIPNVIDELPLVAVLGALAEGCTTIRDAAELRVKESDRIASMAEGLRAFGVRVEERADGMVVHGGGRLAGGVEVDSRGDHRVAMALSILALCAAAPVRVRDVACVGTSYPSFWDDLDRLAAGRSGS